MKTKLKLRTIVDPKFSETYLKLMKFQMPVKTAFKLKKLMNKLSEEQAHYESMRVELLHKYGDKDSNGILIRNKDMVKLSKDNSAKFTKEHAELLSLDVDVDPVKLSELGDAINLTPAELVTLDGIIEE